MALKLNERYPQRWDSPSNDYPQGAFKNLTELGEQDGSYLEQDWLNDYSGFFGALLRNAEMTPDGTIDTAQRSQFYDALVKVAKESVSEEGYRKKDDLLFNGTLKVQATDDVAAGVFLQDIDGTVRGQVVATDQGLQLTQYPEEGGLQTFTFPNTGGEIATTSYVGAQIDAIPEVDTSNLVTKDDITNELGDSTELVASQALVSNHGLGYGQSWVDVTDERSLTVEYTNNTGKPIQVIVSTDASGSSWNSANPYLAMLVDGMRIVRSKASGSPAHIHVQAIIPPLSKYMIREGTSSNDKHGFTGWYELR